MIPSIELQKSIYSLLSQEYLVFEIIPPNHPFPYIRIGQEILTGSSTKVESRTTHSVTMNVFDKGNSSLQARSIADSVANIITNSLSMDGFAVDMVNLSMQRILREETSDSTIFNIVLEFEITLTRL